jgi:hypothetical protein
MSAAGNEPEGLASGAPTHADGTPLDPANDASGGTESVEKYAYGKC